jgi:hypothetical protein
MKENLNIQYRVEKITLISIYVFWLKDANRKTRCVNTSTVHIQYSNVSVLIITSCPHYKDSNLQPPPPYHYLGLPLFQNRGWMPHFLFFEPERSTLTRFSTSAFFSPLNNFS